MNNYQEKERKEYKGSEFLKIYGITIVVAFLLMSSVKFQLEGSASSEQLMAEPTTAPMPPIADADHVLPLLNLKKIFVNLSF